MFGQYGIYTLRGTSALGCVNFYIAGFHFDPPQSKCQGGYPPHFFTYLLKLIAYKKVILYWKNNQSSVLLHHNKIRLGFIDFHSDSTASKLTSSSCGPSMAIIISFDSEEGWSLLRSRFLIFCFLSLNDRSTVAVDMGKTIAIESKVLILGNVTHFASLLKNCNASFWSENPFISSNKRDLNPFHFNLVSCMLTSAGTENVSLSYSTVVGFP